MRTPNPTGRNVITNREKRRARNEEIIRAYVEEGLGFIACAERFNLNVATVQYIVPWHLHRRLGHHMIAARGSTLRQGANNSPPANEKCPSCGINLTKHQNNCLVDLNTNTCTVDKTTIKLNPANTELLYTLRQNWPTVVSYEDLATALWGQKEPEDYSNILKVCVHTVNKKMHLTGGSIAGVVKVGYRFVFPTASPDDFRCCPTCGWRQAQPFRFFVDENSATVTCGYYRERLHTQGVRVLKLLEKGKPVRRHEIASALWGLDYDIHGMPENGDASINVAISNLRRPLRYMNADIELVDRGDQEKGYHLVVGSTHTDGP